MLLFQVGYPYSCAEAVHSAFKGAGRDRGSDASGGGGRAEASAGDYLSGARHSTALVYDMPELGHLRDVVFTLKMMMGPTADDLPESRAWNPTDGYVDEHLYNIQCSDSYLH